MAKWPNGHTRTRNRRLYSLIQIQSCYSRSLLCILLGHTTGTPRAHAQPQSSPSPFSLFPAVLCVLVRVLFVLSVRESLSLTGCQRAVVFLSALSAPRPAAGGRADGTAGATDSRESASSAAVESLVVNIFQRFNLNGDTSCPGRRRRSSSRNV